MAILQKTSSKPKITDQANGKFPNITDGTAGSVNFFSTINPADPLAVGLYPS